MTLTDLLPARITWWDKPTGKHREDDAVDLLQCKLAGARLLVKGLRLQLDDQAREHEKVVARIDERHGEIVRGLEEQVTELQRRLNVGVLAESVVTRTQEMDGETIRRYCTTPVIPLHASPMAAVTDPGHATTR